MSSEQKPDQNLGTAIELARVVAESLKENPTIGELTVEYNGIKVTLKRNEHADGERVPAVG